jgi:hypothetical protein
MILITGLVQTGFSRNGRDYQDQDKQDNPSEKKEQSGFDKEWKKFKVNADIQIDKNDKRIAEFKVKIKGAKEDLRVQYNKDIVVLEQKNSDLKKELREYKYESKDKWEEFKQGFNRDMKSVGNSIKNFFAKKD